MRVRGDRLWSEACLGSRCGSSRWRRRTSHLRSSLPCACFGPSPVAGYYLSGVLVEPAWRDQAIATALTRARLRWVFARTATVFYVTGADNAASLHLHSALGFQEIGRFASERPAAGVDVLSQLARTAASPDDRLSTNE
jgi:ribosomal protein S18 acetylase RimI-like enzyme